MGKSEPKVSVIIPVYNVEPYLRECLDSVVNQTLKEIEIICVNDGSTDNSLQILREYEEKDSRIVVVDQENTGAGTTRNNGIAAAYGKYLLFVDADDFLDKNVLEKAYITAVRDSSEIVVFNTCFYYNDTTQSESLDWVIKKHRLPDYMPFAGMEIKNNHFTALGLWSWNKLYLTRFVRENNLQFSRYRLAQDLSFIFLSVIQAKRISLVEDNTACYYYRKNRNGANTSVSMVNREWKCLRCEMKIIRDRLFELGLFPSLERDYINMCLHYFIWGLEHTSGLQQEEIYQTLQNSWFTEFEIIGQDEDYFYSKLEYRAFRQITESDYKQWIDNKPKMSIIIPNCNDVQGLRKCLDSILGQTFQAFEVICCIDNDKTDSNLEIIKEYAKKDNRVALYIRKNADTLTAMKAGLRKAIGEFLVFMAANSVCPTTNWLETQYTVALGHCAEFRNVSYELLEEQSVVRRNIFKQKS